MTTMELEQRVVALERAVAQLSAQLSRLSRTPNGTTPVEQQAAPPEEALIPGVEYPLVLDVPPKESFRVRARIVSVELGRQDLALSDTEWANLHLEAEDE